MATMGILPGALCPKYTENEQFICRAVDGIRHENTKTCNSWSTVRDYGPILWEIEAMHYILLVGMPKPF